MEATEAAADVSENPAIIATAPEGEADESTRTSEERCRSESQARDAVVADSRAW